MALINTRILMLVFCSNCLQLTLSLIRMYLVRTTIPLSLIIIDLEPKTPVKSNIGSVFLGEY